MTTQKQSIVTKVFSKAGIEYNVWSQDTINKNTRGTSKKQIVIFQKSDNIITLIIISAMGSEKREICDW